MPPFQLGLRADRLRDRHVVGAARVVAHHRGLDAGELHRAQLARLDAGTRGAAGLAEREEDGVDRGEGGDELGGEAGEGLAVDDGVAELEAEALAAVLERMQSF